MSNKIDVLNDDFNPLNAFKAIQTHNKIHTELYKADRYQSVNKKR